MRHYTHYPIEIGTQYSPPPKFSPSKESIRDDIIDNLAMIGNEEDERQYLCNVVAMSMMLLDRLMGHDCTMKMIEALSEEVEIQKAKDELLLAMPV